MSNVFTLGHAVIVGVGGDLPNTVDDAEGLAKILKDQSRCAYPENQVQLLTGSEATRVEILTALEDLAQAATEESTVLIYFSGHGYRVISTTGKHYYMMPYGYNLDKLDQTAISGIEFTDHIGAITAKKVLVLLDCCFAFGLDSTKAVGFPLEKAAVPMPPEALSVLAQGSGRQIIASSRDDEVSYAGKPYSAFTLALIEALCGKDVATKDGFVRVTDLALYTHKRVSQRTKNKQHPVLSYKDADNFVLAYYAGGDATPKKLPFDEEPWIESTPGELEHHQPPQVAPGRHSIRYKDQRYWNIGGNVQESERDIVTTTIITNYGDRAGGLPADSVDEAFADLANRLQGVSDNDRKEVEQAAERVRVEAKRLERGETDAAAQAALQKRVQVLYALEPDIARVLMQRLASPGASTTVTTRNVASKLLSSFPPAPSPGS
jgi:hypothetical protein